MTRGPLTGWSEREQEILRRMWREGRKVAEIAAQLPGRTRNAVIGRAHRLDLPQRACPIKDRKVYVDMRREARKQPLRPTPHPPKPPAERDARAALPRPKPATTAVMRPSAKGARCQFPLTDDRPWRFCGEPAEHGPYCAAHRKRCYQARTAE